MEKDLISLPSDLRVETHHTVRMFDDKLVKLIDNFEMRLAAHYSGYKSLTDWHPVIPEDWGTFPQLKVQCGTVFRGSAETWAYNHHHTLAKSGDTYIIAWSGGFLHEDYPGQEVHFSTSMDGLNWAEMGVVAATPKESGLVRNNIGLLPAGGKVYCYVGVADNFKRDVAPPGMCSMDKPKIHMDIYETEDMKTWKQCNSGLCEGAYLFEGPRPTRGGRLIAGAERIGTGEIMMLIWDDASQPAAEPRVVSLPKSPEGIQGGQTTWYQTDDGRIWMFAREGEPCKLALSVSDDEGDTWTPLYDTDIPNTNVRAYAGRLSDGRFFLCSSISSVHLDRRHMHLALSDDGRCFDRMYTLLQGETTRRVNGRHKEDGWHYASGLVDGDRLMIAHSINKEDIAVASVDMSKVK
ncbi:MAG: exo-alpha-sialidase [Candidatus Omnitrophica bacterium]|nr:exo-alpha-sialidase [Candidatus Omnitrophota bacterium]